jgi:hypothetical protein
MAVFRAGAGQMGDYDCCAWQVRGQGQFRPLEGSKPFIGEQGEIERVDEYRVETICDADKISAVVAALKLAHPYEEPAYDVWALVDA